MRVAAYFNGSFYVFAALATANSDLYSKGLTTPSIAKSTDGITWTAVGLYNNYAMEAAATASYFAYSTGRAIESGNGDTFSYKTSTWQHNNTLYWSAAIAGVNQVLVYGTTDGVKWFRSHGQRPVITDPNLGMLYLGQANAFPGISTSAAILTVQEPEKVNYYIYQSQVQD